MYNNRRNNFSAIGIGGIIKIKRKWLSLLLALALVFSLAPAIALAEELPDEVSTGVIGENKVYYGGKYYSTLVDALTAVYMSPPTDTDAAIIYCKPGADVGTMTHGHVADNIIIYGNGAYVSSGEKDLEIDTYGYDRDTGERSDSDESLTKDITVEVHDLNGIAAWGERNTGHTINLKFYNCKNMNRVYFTNTKNSNGVINITLDGCSFDGDKGSNQNTAVYSNSPGTISIKNTTFNKISVGLNLNHKSNSGTQTISVVGCTFTDCAIDSLLTHADTKTYSAPIRIVAKEGAASNLTVTNTTFSYSPGSAPQNGDILLNDGRYDAAEKQGTVTLDMTGTAATIMVQKSGYYTDAGGEVINNNNGETYYADKDKHFTVQTGEVTPPTPPTSGGGWDDTRWPNILQHPQSVSAPAGSLATFSVVANGGPLSYQWQVDRRDGKGFVSIPGATGATLTVGPVTGAENGYQYRCAVTLYGATMYSGAGQLFVTAGMIPKTGDMPGSPALLLALAGLGLAAWVVARRRAG